MLKVIYISNICDPRVSQIEKIKGGYTVIKIKTDVYRFKFI